MREQTNPESSIRAGGGFRSQRVYGEHEGGVEWLHASALAQRA